MVHQYMTLIDAFTNIAQAFTLSTRNAIDITQCLMQYFNFYGIPEKIIMDNGGEFRNEVVKEFLKLHKIDIHFTTPSHHDFQGMVERLHSTLQEHLRILQANYPNEQNLMPYAILAYNNSISSSTGFTPFELTFGHTNLRDNTDLLLEQNYFQNYVNDHKNKVNTLYDNLKSKLEQNKSKVISKRNEKGDEQTVFREGQIVYKIHGRRRSKKDNKFIGPYTIKRLLDNNKAEIVFSENNKSETIHLKELKLPH